jgi:hypothetical protein
MFLTAVDQHFQSTSASPPFQTLQRFLLPFKSKKRKKASSAASLLYHLLSPHPPDPFCQWSGDRSLSL